MHVQFHVLASGSSGNACVLDVNGFGVLLDFGLSPRELAPRMKTCRVSWDRIHAVVLTHTHSDHVQAATLAHFAKLRLPIYCHEEHAKEFDHSTRAYAALDSAGLIRHFEPGERLQFHANCQCVPFVVSHDAAMTCGFRFEGPGWAIGYAADLGSWTQKHVQQLADVDLLALEFNHDVALQMSSGRHSRLIRRVLGDRGHLSNAQAAGLFREIVQASEPGRLRQLVQLHLSRDCNRPELAAAAAQGVLDRLAIDMAIHTTCQGQAGPSLELGKVVRRVRTPIMQPMLPFADT